MFYIQYDTRECDWNRLTNSNNPRIILNGTVNKPFQSSRAARRWLRKHGLDPSSEEWQPVHMIFGTGVEVRVRVVRGGAF